jgi:hypothetical protein
MVAQVIKRYARRRVVGVAQRVVRGTQEAVQARLKRIQGEGRTPRSTPPTSSGFKPPCAPVLPRWSAKLARRFV